MGSLKFLAPISHFPPPPDLDIVVSNQLHHGSQSYLSQKYL